MDALCEVYPGEDVFAEEDPEESGVSGPEEALEPRLAAQHCHPVLVYQELPGGGGACKPGEQIIRYEVPIVLSRSQWTMTNWLSRYLKEEEEEKEGKMKSRRELSSTSTPAAPTITLTSAYSNRSGLKVPCCEARLVHLKLTVSFEKVRLTVTKITLRRSRQYLLDKKHDTASLRPADWRAHYQAGSPKVPGRLLEGIELVVEVPEGTITCPPGRGEEGEACVRDDEMVGQVNVT